jgi:hypothetical protein
MKNNGKQIDAINARLAAGEITRDEAILALWPVVNRMNKRGRKLYTPDRLLKHAPVV